MGKKNQGAGLGRSLIRDRFGKHSRDKAGVDTFLHTSDLNDGYDWGRLNLQSVTEQNNLEDFLSTAELAGTEFTAEKMNVTVIPNDVHAGLPHGEELTRIQNLHIEHKDLIRIPRRPHWDKEMSGSQLDENERAAFLEWRRSLALLQEVDGIVMTPYEKNLDFWRQLWRVIERSDVVVQIVDARNPLLFYCPDLEAYVHEVDPSKQCVVLINKADFLSQSQRDMWAEYFNKLKVKIAFWSAKEETKRQEEADRLEVENATELTDTVSGLTDHTSDEASEESDNYDDKDDIEEDEVSKTIDSTTNAAASKDTKSSDNSSNTSDASLDKGVKRKVDQETDGGNAGVDTNVKDGDTDVNVSVDSEVAKCVDQFHIDENKKDTSEQVEENVDHFTVNTRHMYTGPDLMEFLRSFHPDMKMTTIGMVGYPNVGKSSTINAILKMKKVPVSATPGRTKHFQTLYVDKDLMLCDCPGLVFPSFVTTKAELVVSGILPIDQMRDHVPPTALICRVIPRKHLEKLYGVIIAKPREGEDPYRVPTAEEFLNAYGAMRGFMTSRGQPDCPRSSRYILKDYVNGKLLYCNPPPGVNPEDFNVFTVTDEAPQSEPMTCQIVPESSAIDKAFFQKDFSTSHKRTARSGGKDVQNDSSSEKPWRKHNNRKKKEKLRRVYGYLDKQ